MARAATSADIYPVLYKKILHVDPANPKMADRDRFLLSKGHGGAALLACLAELGFFPLEWLDRYYCDDGRLSGHISHHIPGVEFSSASLGHGLPVACGMAMAARQSSCRPTATSTRGPHGRPSCSRDSTAGTI